MSRVHAVSRRFAAALLAFAAAGSLALGLAPSAAAGPHYPWQDPGRARTFTEAAVTQHGLSYCWGGGNENGPTTGTWDSKCNASTGAGFDCSGLVHHALARAGRNPGDNTADHYGKTLGTIVNDGSRKPGDLLFYDWENDGQYDHVMIYLGLNRDNNKIEIIEANGAKGLTSATGHRVRFFGLTNPHRVRRIAF
ncbi:C40 family peptidase [Crossiella sp. CA198]|uniref:C40 family peptidase n=1 Tax=Crossiella sp. CA198 TaxID=3455607 RepID=UPI003F8D1900